MILHARNTRLFVIGSITLVVLGFIVFLATGFRAVAPADPIYDARVEESDDPLVTRVIYDDTASSPTITATSPLRGAADGTVTIVVFSDFGCPYCKTMATTLTRLVSEHPTLRVIWKDFPIVSLHKDALAAHVAARCAGQQGKFWEFHDSLFATGAPFDRASLLKQAQALQLKPQQFSVCLENAAMVSDVEADIAEGNALGVDGTPFLFLNDQRIEGSVSYEELKRAVEIHEQIVGTP